MYTTTERATTSTVTHGTTVFERHLSGSRRTWLRAIAEANALLLRDRSEGRRNWEKRYFGNDCLHHDSFRQLQQRGWGGSTLHHVTHLLQLISFLTFSWCLRLSPISIVALALVSINCYAKLFAVGTLFNRDDCIVYRIPRMLGKQSLQRFNDKVTFQRSTFAVTYYILQIIFGTSFVLTYITTVDYSVMEMVAFLATCGFSWSFGGLFNVGRHVEQVTFYFLGTAWATSHLVRSLEFWTVEELGGNSARTTLTLDDLNKNGVHSGVHSGVASGVHGGVASGVHSGVAVGSGGMTNRKNSKKTTREDEQGGEGGKAESRSLCRAVNNNNNNESEKNNEKDQRKQAQERRWKVDLSRAFENYQTMVDVIDDFTEAYRDYFFFAEFFLGVATVALVIGAYSEWSIVFVLLRGSPSMNVLANASIVANATSISSLSVEHEQLVVLCAVFKGVSMSLFACLWLYMSARVFFQASDVTGATLELRERTNRLCALLASSPDKDLVQLSQLLYSHVDRGASDVGFRSMGVVISPSLASTLMYAFLTVASTVALIMVEIYVI
jgi:hypothetical protein